VSPAAGSALTPRDVAAAAPGETPRVESAQWVPALFLALALVLPAVEYYPVTRNFFFQDDFLNLYEIADKNLWEFILRMHGGHLLMTRNALFALFYHTFGTNEANYFWAVYLTHLLNVALLFLTIRSLTDSVRLACFGASAWGLMPVHAGSLGWYSVYGQVVVAACVLWIVSGMARVAAGKPLPRAAPLLWVALIFAAMTSFGVGIGLTLVMPVVAYLLVPPERGRARVMIPLAVVAAATPLIYLLVQHYNRQFDGGLAPTDMATGALTYLSTYVHFLLDLIGYAIGCLTLGRLQIPAYYPTAGEYAVAGAWVVATAVVFRRAPAAVRRQILACLLLAFATYGMIAAGRSVFVTPKNSPWMVRSQRFHYAGPVPLAILLCIVLARLGAGRVGPRAGTALLLLWMAAMVGGRFWRPIQLPIRQVWGARRETTLAIDQIRKRIAAAQPDATVFIPNERFKSVGPMLYGAVRRFPGLVGIFVIYFPYDVVDGHKVFFLEADPEVIQGARDSRRASKLLKSYASVGRKPPPTPAPVWPPRKPPTGK
jgi:hypothetical protein